MTQISKLKDLQKTLRLSKAKGLLDYQQKVELNVLTVLIGNLENEAKNLATSLLDLPDPLVIKFLRKYASSASETAGLTQSQEIFQQAEAEARFLNSLIPAGMSVDEIFSKVSEFLSQSENPAGIGAVVRHFKTHYDGQYDPATLTDITKRML